MQKSRQNMRHLHYDSLRKDKNMCSRNELRSYSNCDKRKGKKTVKKTHTYPRCEQKIKPVVPDGARTRTLVRD